MLINYIMRKESNNIGTVIILLSVVILTCCGNNDHTDDQSDLTPVSQYVARAESLKTRSGKNRIELSWTVKEANNIKSYKIYWNNRKEYITGSIASNASDTMKVILTDMEEGIYHFDILLYDANGNSSIASSILGHVFGEHYQKSLIQCKIKSLKRVNNDVIIQWGENTTNKVAMLIEYTDIVGTTKKHITTESFDSDTIPKVLLESEMKYVTGYLPLQNALDTFYTEYGFIQPDKKILFSHPGIINDKTRLDHLHSTTLGAEKSIAYEQVKSYLQQNSLQDNFPSVIYVKASGSTPTEIQFRQDPITAYGFALKWVRTGDAKDAEQAIRILNGWTYNFKKMDVAEGTQMLQTQLEAAWVIPTLAATAEILKWYQPIDGNSSGWYYSDIESFSSFLVQLMSYVEPMIKDIDQDSRRYNNWGASAGYARIAAGVFLDNKPMYDDGIRLVKKLIPEIIKTDGEVYELCSRDCGHPQYSMNALTYAAEIARIQSDHSVYTANSNRIMTGWEWIVDAFSGKISCRDCTGLFVHPGIEVAVSFYRNMVTPELLLFMEKQRPFVPDDSRTFLGFTTFTHYD